MPGSGASVFVSYCHCDESSALWLAAVLRDSGYCPSVQADDFDAGENFVVRIDRALTDCRWIVCLLSPSYLRSIWCREEWTSALVQKKLVPVRIEACEPTGLLATRTYVDIVGLERRQAVLRLLGQLEKLEAKRAARHESLAVDSTRHSATGLPSSHPSGQVEAPAIAGSIPPSTRKRRSRLIAIASTVGISCLMIVAWCSHDKPAIVSRLGSNAAD
ncbi:MAG TPA: toll/interleukin-1 receptor domain-containing protein, partial [Polyangiaceae bacterium]